ncbi:hypothetical protein HHL17_32260 [Chitinophaga sp. G-6-1-13]|uniref:Transcriptional regulator, AbiEi antitoxin, Type IV TA system n=1 Tax=Chitinophaga fulva TaxID=2728842 RepID=A0A848GZA8_9BACT|nr:hypothetical protein [Chitinophaga fulva]NML41903.1 hypothetical protein [Chitinophaga fulva]
MNVIQAITPFQGQPLTHQLLLSLLKDYKRPNDKIHTLLQEQMLVPVKKGLYVPGPALKLRQPESFLLANHVYGPSYVSMDVALSYHGLIPERVYEISSMTTKASHEFDTPAGRFAYYHLPFPYYAYGIRQAKLDENQYALVATPEKALSDKIVTTAGIILRSRRMVMEYLVENLRIDEEVLAALDTNTMQEWLGCAPKKKSLEMVIKTIKSL